MMAYFICKDYAYQMMITANKPSLISLRGDKSMRKIKSKIKKIYVDT